MGERQCVRARERRAQRVERARPNVAVDDTHCADEERRHALLADNLRGDGCVHVRRERVARGQAALSSPRREKRMLSCLSFR